MLLAQCHERESSATTDERPPQAHIHKSPHRDAAVSSHAAGEQPVCDAALDAQRINARPARDDLHEGVRVRASRQQHGTAQAKPALDRVELCDELEPGFVRDRRHRGRSLRGRCECADRARWTRSFETLGPAALPAAVAKVKRERNVVCARSAFSDRSNTASDGEPHRRASTPIDSSAGAHTMVRLRKA